MGSDEYMTMCENPGITSSEWCDIINGKKDITKISRDRIKTSIIRGIPEVHRGAIWCKLCQCDSESIIYDKDIYLKLVAMENPSTTYMISKDIKRTLPELNLFP